MEEIRRKRFAQLLGRSLELPAGDRQAFIEANCDDPDTREKLLEALARAESKDAQDLPAASGQRTRAMRPKAGSSPPSPATSVRERPEMVGRYRIREILGEGGMGVVYLAEQDEPVYRQLAVKVVRADLKISGGLERFNAERQALARLSHPTIAQMFEAGTTEEGYPYFAMELVTGFAAPPSPRPCSRPYTTRSCPTGLPITEYCDRNRLTVGERLELFRQVCAGVQHAHQRAIIHRDLKPSNILVTEVDGQPVPKIIDFGIAKALDRPLAGMAELTGECLLGTPAYMSPEAMEISDGALDVDTRSDVYALGILLYELLAGCRPFEVKGTSIAKLLVRIASEEAEPPSVRLGLQPGDVQDAVAGRRRVSRDGLLRRLKGDLDWIVTKAIAKERDQRYATAAALADDVECHLHHRPVAAGPPSVRYRMSRFVRRHRAAVAAAAVAVAALVAGITGTSIGMRRAHRSAQRATLALEEVQEVSAFLSGLFEDASPGKTLGETITARELLDRGAARVRSGFAGQPLARARFMRTIGVVYGNLGLYEQATSLLEEALNLQEASVATLDIAATLHDLGNTYRAQGRYEQAEPVLQRALVLRQEALGEDDPLVATTTLALGVLLMRYGRYQEAEALERRALALREQILGNDHVDVAAAADDLANLYRELGRNDEAEKLYLRAVGIYERSLGSNDPTLAGTLSNLAYLYADQGRFEEAEEGLSRSRAIMEKVLGPEHPHVSLTLGNMAALLHAHGKLDEAGPLYERALALQQKTIGSEHPSFANTLGNLGELRWQQGRLAEAEELCQRSLTVRETILDAENIEIAWSLWCLAGTYRDQGRYAEAEPLYTRALAIREKLLPPGHPEVQAVLSDYAQLLRATGRIAEAEALETRIVPPTE